MNSTEFAAVPKEILLNDTLSLGAKGIYAVVCTNPMEQRTTLEDVRRLLPTTTGLEEAWEELVDFLEAENRRRIMKEAMEELAAAMGEERKTTLED